MRIPRIATFILFMLLMTNATALSSKAQEKPKGDDLTLTLGRIVKARDEVRGYVLDIKDKFKDSPQAAGLAEAKKKYRAALGAYNGWVVAVKRAIREGKAKDIQNDPSYRKLGDEAGQAAKEFLSFAESQTGQSKGVFAAFSGLVDIGLKIWNGYKDRQEKERKTRAEEFEKDTRWSQWEEIK